MDEKAVLQEIAALENQRQSKISERDSLSIEILQIEDKIRSMNNMFLTSVLAEKGRQLTAVGLTEAIRILLRKHGKHMTAADVKMGLEILGFEVDRFKNPASVIHNTLKRMAGPGGELFYNGATKTYQLLARWDLNDPNNPLYTSGMRPFPDKKK